MNKNINSTNNFKVVKKIPFTKKAETMFAFFWLYTKYLSKGWLNIFFVFVFPMLLGLILGPILPAWTTFPALALLPIMLSGIAGLAGNVAEWKNTSIIKNIGLSSLSKTQFIFSIYIVHIIYGILGYIVSLFALYGISHIDLFISTGSINYPDPTSPELFFTLKMTFEYVNYGYLSLFVFLTAISSISIGYLIGILAKSVNKANIISLIVALFAAFLSGVFLSMYSIIDIPSLEYMSMVMPTRYSSFGYMNSFFNLTNPEAGITTLRYEQDSISYYMNNPYIVDAINASFPSANLTVEKIYNPSIWGFDSGISIAFSFVLTALNFYVTNFSKRR